MVYPYYKSFSWLEFLHSARSSEPWRSHHLYVQSNMDLTASMDLIGPCTAINVVKMSILLCYLWGCWGY